MNGLCKSNTRICYVIFRFKKIKCVLHYLVSCISDFWLYNTKGDVLKLAPLVKINVVRTG